MREAFDLLEQVGYPVKTEARPKVAEIADLDPKGSLAARGGLSRQSAPQGGVHSLPEGAAQAPRIRLQLRRDVVIKGECGAHILMLQQRHHDVKHGRPGL